VYNGTQSLGPRSFVRGIIRKINTVGAAEHKDFIKSFTKQVKTGIGNVHIVRRVNDHELSITPQINF